MLHEIIYLQKTIEVSEYLLNLRNQSSSIHLEAASLNFDYNDRYKSKNVSVEIHRYEFSCRIQFVLSNYTWLALCITERLAEFLIGAGMIFGRLSL